VSTRENAKVRWQGSLVPQYRLPRSKRLDKIRRFVITKIHTT
jgi:hypothetical protein